MAIAAPLTAIAIPTHVRRLSRRPWPRAIRPCQTGWVAPSAVAAATVVSFALDTQVAKCAASATPASSATTPVRRPAPRRSSAANSDRRVSADTGTSTAVASALRQKAIARAGAVA